MSEPMDATGLADMCAWIVEDPEMAGANTALLLARALLAALDACAASVLDPPGAFDDAGLARVATALRIRRAILTAAANERPAPNGEGEE